MKDEEQIPGSAADSAPTNRTDKALELIFRYHGIDGAHHKDWLIDQVTRVLAGDRYDSFVADARAGSDGPETYGWPTGIAP